MGGLFVEVVRVSLVLSPSVKRAQSFCSSYVLLLLRTKDSPPQLAGKFLFMILYDAQVLLFCSTVILARRSTLAVIY